MQATAVAANAQQLRQIKIKTGVLKRSVKDHQSYTKEKQDQEAKLEEIKSAADADASAISMKEKELAETMAVLPKCLTNIQKAIDDLTQIVGTVEESLDGNEEALTQLKEGDDWKAADEQINAANEYLESLGQ